MVTRYVITDGPSKFDLMLALFDGSKHVPRMVTMTAYTCDERAQKLEKERWFVAVTGLTSKSYDHEWQDAKDEPRNFWQFQGRAFSAEIGHIYQIEGLYNTQSREGSFGFVE
ncbi:MAG: hypothetical protein U0514_03965 [Candidatus Andersenbacteria bacterium]